MWQNRSRICFHPLPPSTAGATSKLRFFIENKGETIAFLLFMFSAFCATLFATCQVFEVNTSDAAKGNLKELEAIAAAVIGGIVMTGGFGTILGIIVGAFIFGLAKEAFFYIPGIDGSFYRVFLGFVIIASALLNENIRKRIMGNI